MNIFAWNIVLKWNNTLKTDALEWFDFDYLQNLSKTWDKVLYLSGTTSYKKSSDIVKKLQEYFWEILKYDISIITEDKIDIFDIEFEEWIYELASFEGEHIDYNEIFDRFKDIDNVASVREAEVSERFWNKVVKVEFIY